MSERLTRERWLEEGLAVFRSEGPAGLAAERMARRLGVSRGSFYWHFSNSQEFEGAVLGAWEEQWTTRIVNASEAGDHTPRERLYNLIKQTGGRDAQIYAAAKKLANGNGALTELMDRVDSRRIELVAGILRSGGIEEPVANLRARIIYSWAIGHMIITSEGVSVPSEIAETLTSMGFGR